MPYNFNADNFKIPTECEFCKDTPTQIVCVKIKTAWSWPYTKYFNLYMVCENHVDAAKVKSVRMGNEQRTR